MKQVHLSDAAVTTTASVPTICLSLKVHVMANASELKFCKNIVLFNI